MTPMVYMLNLTKFKSVCQYMFLSTYFYDYFGYVHKKWFMEMARCAYIFENARKKQHMRIAE